MKDRPQKNVGKFVKYYRTLKNLTRRDLCKKAGLSHSYINHLESGLIRNPRYDILCAICDALEISISKLVNP